MAPNRQTKSIKRAPVSKKTKSKPKTKVTKVPVNYAAIARSYSEVDRQKVVERIRAILDGDRPVMGAVRKALLKTLSVMTPSSGMVGPASISDDVMSITGSPRDIPVMPLSGFQFLERRVRVTKLATDGAAAGGWNASLYVTDLKSYSSGYFRVKSITSWTASSNSTNESQFAGLQTAASSAGSGTESLPSWNEDWTRSGVGYAGISIKYPLGDFLMFSTGDTTTIATHFTSLGGTGGVTGVPVIFDVVLEVLI